MLLKREDLSPVDFAICNLIEYKQVIMSKVLRGVITDIDGTLTNEKRLLSTAAIETIRVLQNHGIEVVLASGNTSCILKGLTRLIGTGGSFIGENGGVYRIGYTGQMKVLPDRTVALKALDIVQKHFLEKGIELDLYSQSDRFADVAFARTVPVEEVRALISDLPVTILDTQFAIHIQEQGFDKGFTFLKVCDELKISPSEFLAIGDSENDIGMIKSAGIGCTVRNATDRVKQVAGYIAGKSYGDGFVEIMERFFKFLNNSNER